jgi:hypothetical protein
VTVLARSGWSDALRAASFVHPSTWRRPREGRGRRRALWLKPMPRGRRKAGDTTVCRGIGKSLPGGEARVVLYQVSERLTLLRTVPESA